MQLLLVTIVVAKRSLHFLRAFGFRMTGLSLEKQIYVIDCHSLKLFFDVLGGSQNSFLGSPNLSRLLYLAERDGAFLQEWELGSIAEVQNLVLSN